MMLTNALHPTKILAHHLARSAIIYVRQSSGQQLSRHPESAEVQTKLKDRAVSWGWPADRVIVLDGDQGQTAATTDGRDDFAWLISKIALQHVGLVMGFQFNRLSREDEASAALVKACRTFDTLIADMDGIYDPFDHNDRVVLQIKSMMGGIELHQIQQRMQTARLNKAQRGEWQGVTPIGYVVGPNRKLQFDPDEQVQTFVRLVFDRYEALGSVNRLMKYLTQEKILVPRRSALRHNRGQLEFHRPNRSTIYYMLYHPVYAGVHTWARRKIERQRGAVVHRNPTRRFVTAKDCDVFLPNNHDAYISWSQYEANAARPQKQRQHGPRPGPARKTQSLVAGILVCGRCGCRMQTHYTRTLRYDCRRRSLDRGEPGCQCLVGDPVDKLVSEQVLLALQPARLQLSMRVAQECEREWKQLDKQWKLRLERAHQDAKRAERQYSVVEPENRLVARSLESNWEQALQAARDLAEQYDEFRKSQRMSLTDEQRAQIESLATNLPQLWNSPRTSIEDKRQIIRLLLDHVTITAPPDSNEVKLELHWAGGSVTQHTLSRTVHSWWQVGEYAELAERILKLHSRGWTSSQIARQLNHEGFKTTRRTDFTRDSVRKLLSRIKVTT